MVNPSWINPSANMFVFGGFNVHHKDLLTYSDGPDRPGEFCQGVIQKISLGDSSTKTCDHDCDKHS